MPNINIDDAYILNETGAQVDQVTGLYFKNENASDTEKAQARANIGAGGTNPNLLDNAYFVGGGSQLGDGIFPINQRGQTSYGNGQTFDRWKLSAGGTVTLTQSGITFNGLLFQKKALDLVVGETYTLSRQTQNGEVVSLTGVVPSTEGWMIGSDAFGVYFRPSTKVCDIQIWGDYSLRAMKLEKGTISTLANDVPPDFGEELAKCQRYLFIFKGGYLGWFYGDGATMRGIINTPVQPRATPTVSFTSNGFLSVATGAYVASAGTFSVGAVNGTTLRMDGSLGRAVANGMYILYLDSGQTLTLSAEL